MPPTATGYRILCAVLREVLHFPQVREAIAVGFQDWEAVDRSLKQMSKGTTVPEDLLQRCGLRQAPVTVRYCREVQPPPAWWMPWVGPHAVERYQEHYPNAEHEDLLWDLAGGIEISAELAQTMLGRYRSTPGDVYVISRERRGIFVCSKQNCPPGSRYPTTLITYIRLSTSGEEYARQEWPIV